MVLLMSRKPVCGIGLVLGLLAGSARAQLVVEEVGDNYLVTDVSSNGSVVVGNINGSYETFYWTSETGPLPLGRATVPAIGVGAGTPDVSADGTKVSATILTDDGLYATQGIWDLNTGWQALMPPIPPDGGVGDQSLGSAWGLSGDGETLVGLYIRPTSTNGYAHPSAATVSGGVVDLGTPGNSGRANAVNYDGSVIGGWIERPDGQWEPTVWVNGVMEILGDFEVLSEVNGVNRDGTILVGESYTHPNAAATIWRWNGSAWDRDYIGGLPGMNAFTGLAWFSAISADGGLAVGGTRPAFAPVYWGMLWTPDTGLVDADDWVAALGATTQFPIVELSNVSDDGRTIIGITQNQVQPFQLGSIVMHCVSDGDADQDNDVDLHDYYLLQQQFTGAGAGALPSGGAPLDINCDLDIDSDDVQVFVDNLGGPLELQ